MVSVEQDAAEYGAHIKHGGWRLGLLVARCVEPDNGNGGRRASGTAVPVGKVSANEFARQAGTSRPRVMRHLEAWEAAADARLVPHAAALAPDLDVDLPDEETIAWSRFYRAEGPRNVREPARLQALEAEAERQDTGPSKVKDVASNPKALAAAILADGPTAEAAQKALNERHQRIHTVPEPRDVKLPPELAETDAEVQRAHEVGKLTYAIDAALNMLMVRADRGWDADQRAAAAAALRNHRIRIDEAIVRLVGIDEAELARWLSEAND